MQKFCKTSRFGLIKSYQSRLLDQKPLNTIVDQAKETAPLFISLVLSMGLISRNLLTSYLVLMKLIAIFVIFCRFCHQNNSNYIYLFVTTYLYFANVKIDAITFLNYFDILVLYNVLLKKLKNIIASIFALFKPKPSTASLQACGITLNIEKTWLVKEQLTQLNLDL